MAKSKRRLEMGEKAWTEHRRQKEYEKVLRYRRRNTKNVSEWRRRFKQELIQYKGGKCQICGYDKVEFPSVFAFHHRDPNQKDFSVSRRIKSKDATRVEVDKCDLLCQNCHHELHDNLRKESRK